MDGRRAIILLNNLIQSNKSLSLELNGTGIYNDNNNKSKAQECSICAYKFIVHYLDFMAIYHPQN